MIQVLFVCTGNICRSPMAEAVFRHLVETEGLAGRIGVDSAGTMKWHAGELPHPGTLQVLQQQGIATDGLRGRQVVPEDFQRYDYIVAMDRGHLWHLERMAGKQCRAQIRLLLEGVPGAPEKDVPDPYTDGRFDYVYDLVSLGCRSLLTEVAGLARQG